MVFIITLFFICSLVFTFFVLFAFPVQAKILINEVYPNPLSGESEWIELFNSSTVAASLNNWTIEDKLSSSKVIYSFIDITLSSNQYYLASISAQLNNSGDGVVLKSDIGEHISEMNYDTSTQGTSWSLNIDSNEYLLTIPTPLKINYVESPIPSISPTPVVSSSPFVSPLPSSIPDVLYEDLTNKLELVSVMSCPDGNDEWFELQNISDHTLNGSLYLIDDQDNKFSFEINILSGQKQRYYLNRHFLNNSGDSFTLIQEPDNILFSYDFLSCKEKGLEFTLQNGQLLHVIQSNTNLNSTSNDDQGGDILGISSDDQEISVNKENNIQGTFKIPFSYLGKVKLFNSDEASESAEIISKDLENDMIKKEGEEDSKLLAVSLIIFGGVTLSFLGIMYFYGKDWTKDKIMA